MLYDEYAIDRYNQVTRNGETIIDKSDPRLCPLEFSMVSMFMQMPAYDNTEIIVYAGKLTDTQMHWLRSIRIDDGGHMMNEAEIMRHIWPNGPPRETPNAYDADSP